MHSIACLCICVMRCQDCDRVACVPAARWQPLCVPGARATPPQPTGTSRASQVPGVGSAWPPIDLVHVSDRRLRVSCQTLAMQQPSSLPAESCVAGAPERAEGALPGAAADSIVVALSRCRSATGGGFRERACAGAADAQCTAVAPPPAACRILVITGVRLHACRHMLARDTCQPVSLQPPPVLLLRSRFGGGATAGQGTSCRRTGWGTGARGRAPREAGTLCPSAPWRPACAWYTSYIQFACDSAPCWLLECATLNVRLVHIVSHLEGLWKYVVRCKFTG